jgi:peptide deformylase
MKIVLYPHPSLRHKAVPISGISKQTESYAREMLDLMYEGKGLGLAGPQVALPYQIFVSNLNTDERELPAAERVSERVFINPVIMDRKGSIEGEEGCLSFPGLYAKVRRAKSIAFQAYNLKGELVAGTVSELEARVFQHEVDHLRGELFIDKVGALAKISCRGSVNKFERDFRRAQERGEIPTDIDLERVLVALEREP